MQALPAITLSENQPQNVSLPIGVTAVQLHNASVGFLTVNISGDSTYVGPQSWVTIPVGGQTASMTLTLLDASAGSVYATVFMATDGDLPNTLVSGSLNQQQVTVDSGTVAIAGTPTVDFASGSTVAISGTPTIIIQSGSVNVGGGQLTSTNGVALQPTADQLLSSDLGDGSAGAVTFGANSTLTADLQATSITLPSGVTIGTGGYRIRCQGTCSVDGTFDNSASDSTSNGVGAPGATGTLAGGAIGSTAYDGNNSGESPVSATIEGGAGGYAESAAFGPGGTTSQAIASPTIATLHTGTLSGGASGGAYASSTTSLAYSGSGGGVILILCAEIVGNGELSANGGNGYAYSGATDCSGGGGGGVVAVGCYTNSFTGPIVANGGSGAGTAGTNYSSGDYGVTMVMVTS